MSNENEPNESIKPIDFSKIYEKEYSEKDTKKSWSIMYKYVENIKKNAFKKLIKNDRNNLIELLDKLDFNIKESDNFKSENDEYYIKIFNNINISNENRSKIYKGLKRSLEFDELKNYKKVKIEIDKEEEEELNRQKMKELEESNRQLTIKMEELMNLVKSKNNENNIEINI